MVSDPREVTKHCHGGAPKDYRTWPGAWIGRNTTILLNASVYFVLFLCIMGIFKLVNRKICKFIKNSQAEQSNILGT